MSCTACLTAQLPPGDDRCTPQRERDASPSSPWLTSSYDCRAAYQDSYATAWVQNSRTLERQEESEFQRYSIVSIDSALVFLGFVSTVRRV